jgi:hypothetical protein
MRMNRPKTDGCPRCAVATGSAFSLQGEISTNLPYAVDIAARDGLVNEF